MQLTLREIRQISFANGLLHFAVQMMVRQLCMGRFGILEHPGLTPIKHGIQPPSIWLLPCVLTSACPVDRPFSRSLQCYFTQAHHTFKCGRSRARRPDGDSSIVQSKSRLDLPPPLKMGRKPDGTFATNPLKRYPGPLCEALSKMVGTCVASDNISSIAHSGDDCTLPMAQVLQHGYEVVRDATDSQDAADIHAECGDHPYSTHIDAKGFVGRSSDCFSKPRGHTSNINFHGVV